MCVTISIMPMPLKAGLWCRWLDECHVHELHPTLNDEGRERGEHRRGSAFTLHLLSSLLRFATRRRDRQLGKHRTQNASLFFIEYLQDTTYETYAHTTYRVRSLVRFSFSPSLSRTPPTYNCNNFIISRIFLLFLDVLFSLLLSLWRVTLFHAHKA